MSEVKVWRYVLSNDQQFGEGWGVVFIDETGIVTAVSDYGNYAQRFHYSGKDFRDFLISCDSGYLIRKFAKRTILNRDATKKSIKETILRKRYEESFSSNEARDEWNLVNECDFYFQEEVSDWVNETTLEDPWEYLVYDYSASAKAFAHRLFPRLVELLKQDRAKVAS